MRYYKDPKRTPELGGLLCGNDQSARARAMGQHGHQTSALQGSGARNHPSEPDDLSTVIVIQQILVQLKHQDFIFSFVLY